MWLWNIITEIIIPYLLLPGLLIFFFGARIIDHFFQYFLVSFFIIGIPSMIFEFDVFDNIGLTFGISILLYVGLVNLFPDFFGPGEY